MVTLATMVLVATGDLETLAETTVLLLVLVYAAVNVSVLALRRQTVEGAHFRTPTAVPVLALGAIAAVLTQQTAATWARAGALLLVGLVLYAVNRLALRRSGPTAD